RYKLRKDLHLAPVLPNHHRGLPPTHIRVIQRQRIRVETTARIHRPIERIGKRKTTRPPAFALKKLPEILQLRLIEQIQPDRPSPQRSLISGKSLLAPIQKSHDLRGKVSLSV